MRVYVLGTSLSFVCALALAIAPLNAVVSRVAVVIVIVGLAFLAKAGKLREIEQSVTLVDEKSPLIGESKNENYSSINEDAAPSDSNATPSFMAGIVVCLLSGAFSPMLNLAVAFGR